MEKDFFSVTSSELSDIFSSDADTNIERKRSVYQSINYSYSKLNAIEKLALELLHLFPDGINITNFERCFSTKKDDKNAKNRNILTLESKSLTAVKEHHLAALEGKSLIELSHGIAKLQSIIGRFAAYQFEKRDAKEKTNYYNDAFNYNDFILEISNKINENRSYDMALGITDIQINNLLFALSYIPNLKFKTIDKHKLLDYIDSVRVYILTESSLKKYLEALRKISYYFEDVANGKFLLELFEIDLLYHHQNFEQNFKRLNKLLPFENIQVLTFQDDVEIALITGALQIYSYEGYTLECLKVRYTKVLYNKQGVDFFYIGTYGYTIHLAFYKFETLLNQQKLSIIDIETFLVTIFRRNHLSKTQVSYTLSKIKKLEWSYIEKLVITNPYTRGLKNLMYAFNTDKEGDKIGYYKEAIKHLDHIKYYHIEAIYYYAKYLKEIDHPDYQVQFDRGNTLALKYQYRFLVHQFIQLRNGTNDIYNSDNYPLDVDFDLNDFIKKYREKFGDKEETDKPSLEAKVIHLPITNKPPRKAALFVEGPTDKTALQEAIRLFQPDLSSKFEIICELDERITIEEPNGKGGGYNWVKSRMKGWITNKWQQKAACLFDYDEDANKAKAEINTEITGCNANSRNLYKVFQIDNGSTNHTMLLVKKKIVIPFALEEMFPLFCWEHAERQGWLNDREGIEKFIQKADGYDAVTQSVKDYLAEKGLSTNLYLTKQVDKNKKQNFMTYLINLSEEDKQTAFEYFKLVVKKLNDFYK